MVLSDVMPCTLRRNQVILILTFLCFSRLIYADVPIINNQQKIVRTISGSIKKCDFHKLGTWGFQVFVGVELDDPKAPYIRFNIPRTERLQYEVWCEKKSDVTIRYRIKRTKTKLGTTYWAEDIKENKKPSE